MTTLNQGDEPPPGPSKSPWVRTILVLGHLAIILGLLVLARSERRERARAVGMGPSIFECLRSDAADAPGLVPCWTTFMAASLLCQERRL